VARHLPWIISEPLVKLIGEDCYTSLVGDLDIGDVQCVKLLFSKAIGLGIVIGGSVMKVPQVLLIVRSGSARGLSLTAFTLETLGYAFQLAYAARHQFPFSTYGENLFLTIQNVIVTVLIVYHGPSALRAKNTSGAYMATLIAAVIGVVLLIWPYSQLHLLQLSTLPIGLVSKIPQIASNAGARSTGNLSAIAVGAQVAGCAARLFTTATELNGDAYVLWGFIFAFVLNAILAIQIWMYWGAEGNYLSNNPRGGEVGLPLVARDYPKRE
ncbi:mannose-P-dolichol utilization defect 1 protein, partial [Clavulina sp. PMI_390]